MTDNSAIYFLNKLSITDQKFVDVGANDGETNSMTYALEKSGWTGILIEPNPILAESLPLKRSSSVVNCAVSSSNASLEFNIVSGPGNLHGLSRFNYTPEFEKHVQKHGGAIEKKIVNCKTLESILSEVSFPKKFAFLKVDVEGHELEVFKSLNLNQYSPRLIVAEDNTKDRDKSVRKYLQRFNYIVIARKGTNNFYVKREDVIKFLPSYFLAKLIFAKWDIKRFIWKLSGKEFVSNNI